MMTITFDKPKDFFHSVSRKFYHLYDYEWMNDPEVQRMILDIDNTTLQNPQVAFSPILGSISVDMLSGGVKGLIMVKHYKDCRAFSSTIWGDNCAEWLCKLSFEVDFIFYSRHSFSFGYGLPRGEVRPINCCSVDGQIFTNSRDAYNYTFGNNKWLICEE